MIEKDFREKFKLSDDTVISNEVIDKFSLYTEGCRLLFNNLSDKINNHIFSITVDGNSFDFKAVKKFNIDCYGFIKGYSSNQAIELYVKNSGYFRVNYEWLSGRDVNQSNFNKSVFEDNFDKDAENEFMIKVFRKAYKKYIDSELYDLINSFKNTHGVVAKYDYYGVKYLYGVGASSPLRFSGVEFVDDLFVYEGGERVFLSDYDIKNAMEKINFLK